MKKIFKTVLVCILAVTCIACGGSKKETAVCSVELEENGIVHEMILEAEGDVVHTMTQVTKVNLFNYTEDEIAALEDSLKQYKAIYEAIEGVSYDAEKKDGNLYEKIVIDMSNKETVEVLQENALLPIDGISNKISLDKTVENLKDQGWTVEVTEK